MSRSDPLWGSWRAFWFLVVATVFIEATFLRFSLPPWIFLASDSNYYLGPALQGQIAAVGPRTIPYPLFCWMLLGLSSDWRALAIAQHTLGLLGPGLLLLAWYRLGAKIHSARFTRALHDLAGLAIPLLLLPSFAFVFYEHMAMLESFSAFLQCCLGSLLCLLWMPAPPRRRLLIACTTSFLGIAMYYANPRWGAAAPLVVLLAASGAFLQRERTGGWPKAVWPVFAAAVAAWLVIGLPQAWIHNRNPWTKTFTNKHLLWMHADLAAAEFRRELAAVPAPLNANLLRTLEAKITPAVIGEGTSGWATIPFNAEKMLYGPGNPDDDLIAAFPNDPDGYARFCRHYYFLIIRHQTLAFADRVWVELRHFYTADGGALADFPVALTGYAKRSAEIARMLAQSARPVSRPPLLKAAAHLETLGQGPLNFQPPAFLTPTDDFLSAHLASLSLLGVLAAAAVLLSPRLRADRTIAISAGVSLAAVGVLFAQVLTLALVTASAPRYNHALRTLVVFSVVAVLSLALNLGLALGRKLLGRTASS